MRYRLFILLITVLAVSCLNTTDKEKSAAQPATAGVSANVDTANFTSIQWIDSAKKLGKIVEGQNLQLSFKFKNTGDKPLIIESVSPACGCTVADYPKTPIAPGQEGEITGAFDSKGREGFQRKTISVMTNTKGNRHHQLSFEVDVQKAKS